MARFGQDRAIHDNAIKSRVVDAAVVVDTQAADEVILKTTPAGSIDAASEEGIGTGKGTTKAARSRTGVQSRRESNHAFLRKYGVRHSQWERSGSQIQGDIKVAAASPNVEEEENQHKHHPHDERRQEADEQLRNPGENLAQAVRKSPRKPNDTKVVMVAPQDMQALSQLSAGENKGRDVNLERAKQAQSEDAQETLLQPVRADEKVQGTKVLRVSNMNTVPREQQRLEKDRKERQRHVPEVKMPDETQVPEVQQSSTVQPASSKDPSGQSLRPRPHKGVHNQRLEAVSKRHRREAPDAAHDEAVVDRVVDNMAPRPQEDAMSLTETAAIGAAAVWSKLLETRSVIEKCERPPCGEVCARRRRGVFQRRVEYVRIVACVCMLHAGCIREER